MFREAFQEFLSLIKHIQSKLPISVHLYGLLYYLQTSMGSTVSTVTSIYAGRYGVQILAVTRELSLLQNFQTSSSTHPASNSSFSSGSKVASADSLTTHIHIEPRLKIGGAIPPLNLSASMAHIGTD